ncbi:MAG TPA: formylglycine-generating enzyme family protein [Tepidisphaeraceae bacterium]|jgi:formylglycine-generating enzyme required for sulfatase activity|nr:formylglycine-generating enzyme family protein [Tepidisphaeraceae bacterium]
MVAIGLLLGAAARGEAPPAAPAGAMKNFTQKITGSDVTFDLVAIPPGKFLMGSPAIEKGHKKDEAPQIEVQVDAFYMQSTSVTWDEYNLFLSNYDRMAKSGQPRIPKDKWADAVTYPTPMYELEAGPKLDRMGRPGRFPAVIMSQFAARQYTKWLSKKTGRFYRLPTEAEWEYACRAGTTTAYSFGDDIGPDGKILAQYSWYVDDSNIKDGDPAYRKVGTLKPNPWGLYDMHGNVANWVIDGYDATWYSKFAGKTSNWHDIINWPSKQYPRCFRGGGYDFEAEDCRSAARHHSSKDMNIKDPQLPQSPHWLTEGFSLGIRVVAPVQEPSEAEKIRFWDVDDDYTARILERDREIREILPTPAK